MRVLTAEKLYEILKSHTEYVVAYRGDDYNNVVIDGQFDLEDIVRQINRYCNGPIPLPKSSSPLAALLGEDDV